MFKVESYLIETNKMFATTMDCSDSIKYLIVNIWNLAADEYSKVNLDNLTAVKDELINKLENLSLARQQALFQV